MLIASTRPAQALAFAGAACLAVAAASAPASAEGETMAPVFSGELPDLPGRLLRTAVIEYAPGAATDAHHHDAFVFAYVLEGSIRSQVEGEPAAKVYAAGEHWVEQPGAHHIVCENVSDAEGAKLLVVSITQAPDAPPQN